MIYIDSSALVKRYIEEDGSDKVNALLEERSVAAASRLAYPEILAAITRRHKAKEIETGAFERIKKAFKSDWASFAVVEFHLDVFKLIDEIIIKYALRGADSVHLSSALWLKKAMKQDVVFVASDLELIKAAKGEKLQTYNPAR
ncbi:MAG: type II toxin-antitoxin system VapC family toxin [Syntrophobacteraceae bacterium]|nr:type II toxin-antitoxin system VapC family toxin [Syntrophobacteraceae bacterium]